VSALREASLAVARAALAGGHLDPEQLRLALLVQDRVGDCANPTLLLPLLRWKFLPSEALPKLTQAYKRALALSDGPRPPPPTIRPTEREQAEALLARGDDLLLDHPDLDPPGVQDFLRDADAAAFSDAPQSGGLGLTPAPPPPRVLDDSDLGPLDLGPSSASSSAYLEESSEGPLELASSTAPSSGRLFEDSGEGPLELVSSSSQAASDSPAPRDLSMSDSDDLLGIDDWASESSAPAPVEDAVQAPDPDPRGPSEGWGTSARLAAAQEKPPPPRPQSARRAKRPTAERSSSGRAGKTSRRKRSARTKRPQSAPPPGAPGEDHRFEFRGSVLWLLCLQLLGTAAFVGVLLGLLAGLPACGWRPAERLAQHLLRELPALQAVVASVQASLAAPPLALLTGALLLLVLSAVVSNAVRLYRVQNTYVFDMRLACREGWGLREELFTLLLTLLTAGLGLPWVIARRRRWFYRSCHVRGTSLTLDFDGTGLQALGLTLLTLLSLPLVVVSLGLLAIRVQFLWLAWERRHTWIPDGEGELHPTRFSARGHDYFRYMAPRHLATLFTLGLYRPWALVASWRWLDHHTAVEGSER
jgi:hypothetical protein